MINKNSPHNIIISDVLTLAALKIFVANQRRVKKN
jgi:hypothetical protein